jgi:hypothetical protein
MLRILVEHSFPPLALLHLFKHRPCASIPPLDKLSESAIDRTTDFGVLVKIDRSQRTLRDARGHKIEFLYVGY